MQFLLVLCQAMSGTSTKSGSPQPYAMYSATVLSEPIPYERPNRKVVSIGLASSELSVSEGFYPELSAQFHRDFNGMPVEYDFKTSMDGGGKVVLTGFASAPSSVATFETSPASKNDFGIKPPKSA